MGLCVRVGSDLGQYGHRYVVIVGGPPSARIVGGVSLVSEGKREDIRRLTALKQGHSGQLYH